MRPVFIGDEVTAAGYRLAGLDTRIANAAEAPRAFLQALREAPPLLLITAECAAALAPAALDAALARLEPPVAVVPDAGNRAQPPDLLARVRAGLGIVSPEEPR